MKKLKLFKYVILFFVLSLLLMSCSTEKSKELDKDSVVVAISPISEPENGFDPCTGWGRYGSPIIQSTLVETDKDMNIINDIALDYYVSEDGLKWTFNIRDDVYFSDGVSLTSEDVKFTFETAKNSGSIVDLTNLESVNCIDSYKVEFNLLYPQSTFIYTIAETGIVPKHIYNKNYGQNPIGSGAYKLKQWDKGQQVILEANEYYYKEQPKIKNIIILFMSEDSAFAAAKAGKVDISYTTPEFAKNNKIDNMKIINIESIDNRGITLPVLEENKKLTENGYKIGNNVTSDVNIRRALSYGIDRNMLIQNVLNGFGRPAYSECDGMPWASEYSYIEYDFNKAINILENSGWYDINDDGIREKNGINAEFDLYYSVGDSVRQALAMAVSEEAKKLGLNINVKGESWDIIDKEMYSSAVLMGWGAQNPMETYLLYHSDNTGRDYYNPEYYYSDNVDRYINEAMAEKDLFKANELWKKVQWDGITGVSTNGDIPFLWLVNVDHIYYIRNELNIGKQKIHPHGHSWPLFSNVKDWEWL